MMKKINYILFPLIGILATGCGGGDDASSKNSKENPSEISIETSDIASDIEESIEESIPSEIISLEPQECLITINYRYENGYLIESKNLTVKQGERLSVNSPEINFMTPDIKSLDFEVENTRTIDITYTYGEEIVTGLTKGRKFDPVMIDYDKGFSFNYAIYHGTEDWQAVFSSEKFLIYNGCLECRNSKNRDEYFARWYEWQSNVVINGTQWDYQLGDTLNYITLSFNPDHTLSVYKNGKLALYYFANLFQDSYHSYDGSSFKTISDLVDNVFYGIENDGFSIGVDREDYHSDFVINYDLECMRLGYAVSNEEEASQIYQSMKTQFEAI